MDSLSCANSPSAYASYDVLVHQLADLLAASSRQILADLPLPFASSYHLIAILIVKDCDLPTEDFYPGRPPAHYFMPMLGVHKVLLRKICATEI
jgi:hypothetical protein